MLTITLRVTQKHVFRPPNKYFIHVFHESLSLKSFHVPKESIGYAKKERKEIHAKGHERKIIIHAKEQEKK
jgi:hypothetical protein